MNAPHHNHHNSGLSQNKSSCAGSVRKCVCLPATAGAVHQRLLYSEYNVPLCLCAVGPNSERRTERKKVRQANSRTTDSKNQTERDKSASYKRTHSGRKRKVNLSRKERERVIAKKWCEIWRGGGFHVVTYGMLSFNPACNESHMFIFFFSVSVCEAGGMQYMKGMRELKLGRHQTEEFVKTARMSEHVRVMTRCKHAWLCWCCFLRGFMHTLGDVMSEWSVRAYVLTSVALGPWVRFQVLLSFASFACCFQIFQCVLVSQSVGNGFYFFKHMYKRVKRWAV